jgi:hypothetical protein
MTFARLHRPIERDPGEASASTLTGHYGVGPEDGVSDTDALRAHVSHRVKKESLHQLASTMVPISEISRPVHALLHTLATWRAGCLGSNEVQL